MTTATMPSLRPNFDRRAGRLGRISLGVVIGWIGGLVAVALIYNTLHASNLAHARDVCADHHQIYLGVTAPRRFISPTEVRCFTFTSGSASDPISTYSLHHGELTDTLDVVLLLMLFGVCVTAGHYADVAIRRLIRSRARGGGSL